jgi:hypothetical protein
MEDEACDCVVEDLLKESFSCSDFASKRKIIEIGRPTPFFYKNGKTVKEYVMPFFYSWYKTELQDSENNLAFCDSVIDTFTEKKLSHGTEV